MLPVERLSPEKLISPGHKQSIYPFVERFLADYGRNPAEVRAVANMEIAAQLVSAGGFYCFTLGSYRPSFAHIPSLMFCRPRRTPVPISWSLASVAPSLLPRQTARLKEIIRAQTAAMAGQKEEAAAEVSAP